MPVVRGRIASPTVPPVVKPRRARSANVSATVVKEGIKFEDRHQHAATTHYIAPNEYTLQWRELLKGIPVYRAAGICSSGEVGFFSILPLVRDELVLVDHSYKSLSVAMVKYLIMQKHGAEKTKELLSGNDVKALRKAINAAVKKLPSSTLQQGAESVDKHAGTDSWTIKQWNIARGRYGFAYDKRKVTGEKPSRILQAEWKGLPTDLVKKAVNKLDKVSFVHGDVSDLADKGQFGLLYLSNALQHRDRDALHPQVSKIEKVVKPGGYVLLCDIQSSYYKNAYPKDWTLVNSTTARDGFGYSKLGWTQKLFKLPA